MTSGTPDPSVDALLDRFIAAWHSGEAPSAAAYLAEAAPGDREELAALIAGFLELAPTVDPNPDAAERLSEDPLVARLTAMEGDWWDARSSATPWGERLRAAREAAGLSLTQLAHDFAARFGLGATDAGRAPTVFAELEAGALPSSGVTARAARALEELVRAPAGSLLDGAAPALGAPVLRGDLPESGADRDRFTELLRTVDDALASEPRPDDDAAHETLHGLLGA